MVKYSLQYRRILDGSHLYTNPRLVKHPVTSQDGSIKSISLVFHIPLQKACIYNLCAFIFEAKMWRLNLGLCSLQSFGAWSSRLVSSWTWCWSSFFGALSLHNCKKICQIQCNPTFGHLVITASVFFFAPAKCSYIWLEKNFINLATLLMQPTDTFWSDGNLYNPPYFYPVNTATQTSYVHLSIVILYVLLFKLF